MASLTLSRNDIALKESAFLTKLLGEGKTICLVRKDDIFRGHGSGASPQREFFFFPTYQPIHVTEIKDSMQQDYLQAMSANPGPGTVKFGLIVQVRAVARITSDQALSLVQDEHPWTLDAMKSKLAKDPAGLYLWILRAYRLVTPLILVERPMYDGSHSWVTLETPLSTREVRAVLPREIFDNRVDAIRTKLSAA